MFSFINRINAQMRSSGLTGFRTGGAVPTGVAGLGALRPNAALCHNFGCFVTVQTPLLPFNPNLTVREKSGRATDWGHLLRLPIIGILVLLLAHLLASSLVWGKWEAKPLTYASVNTPAHGAPEKVATTAPATIAPAVRSETRYLVAETASARLLHELAANDHETVELPSIWQGNLRCTWFRQIGEQGRIIYEAVLNPQGLSETGDGTINLE